MEKIKSGWFIVLFLLTCSSALAQLVPESGKEEEMKIYYFVLLKKGPHRDQDSSAVMKIQQGHLSNIERLYKEGKIDLAGPFAEDGDWRGIFVFNVSDEETVRKLLDSDPAISSGRLSYELKPWYSQKGAMLR